MGCVTWDISLLSSSRYLPDYFAPPSISGSGIEILLGKVMLPIYSDNSCRNWLQEGGSKYHNPRVRVRSLLGPGIRFRCQGFPKPFLSKLNETFRWRRVVNFWKLPLASSSCIRPTAYKWVLPIESSYKKSPRWRSREQDAGTKCWWHQIKFLPRWQWRGAAGGWLNTAGLWELDHRWTTGTVGIKLKQGI